MSETQISDDNSEDDLLHSDFESEFLTIYIAGQIFGIPVLQVQDVLGTQRVTTIPLAPQEVAGSLNLRGRIVTAIDVRRRLGLDPSESSLNESMSVVVEYKDELYSLIIDKVGDVLGMKEDTYQTTPATLDPVWKEISAGIHQLENELLIILDVSKLINSVAN